LAALAVFVVALRVRTPPCLAPFARHVDAGALIHLRVLELPVFIRELHDAQLGIGGGFGPQLVGGAADTGYRDGQDREYSRHFSTFSCCGGMYRVWTPKSGSRSGKFRGAALYTRHATA